MRKFENFYDMEVMVTSSTGNCGVKNEIYKPREGWDLMLRRMATKLRLIADRLDLEAGGLSRFVLAPFLGAVGALSLGYSPERLVIGEFGGERR